MFAPILPTPTNPIFISPFSLGKECVLAFLFSDSRQRAVPRADNCLVGQSENLLPVISKRVLIRNIAAAHGACEKRVSYNCNRTRQSGQHIRDSPRRMPRRQTRLNLERPNLERLAFRDRFRTFFRFEF